MHIADDLSENVCQKQCIEGMRVTGHPDKSVIIILPILVFADIIYFAAIRLPEPALFLLSLPRHDGSLPAVHALYSL